MAKKSGNRVLIIFQIFWEGIVWYCKYLDTFVKYMFFPVFGQIIGVFLIFAVNYFFIVNIPQLISKFPVLDSISLVFTLLIICAAPGFLIFGKAFYDYMIAFASLNSMVYVSRGEKMKNKPLDTKTHDDILKKRLAKYLLLLVLLSLIFIISLCPLFVIPVIIISVYFSLVFQVFMLEESVSPIGAFKRSFYLVKTNYGITVLLLALSFCLTYWIIPSLFVFGFEKAKLTMYLAYPIQSYFDILPINELFSSVVESVCEAYGNIAPDTLPQLEIIKSGNYNPASLINMAELAQKTVKSIIAASVTIFLLPVRSAWFTLLYKTFDMEKTEELRKVGNKKEK